MNLNTINFLGSVKPVVQYMLYVFHCFSYSTYAHQCIILLVTFFIHMYMYMYMYIVDNKAINVHHYFLLV